MKLKISLGFIGGGNMAEALIRGLLSSKTMTPVDCRVCDILEDRLSYLKRTYGVQTVKDTPQVIRSSRAIILAVKPQNIDKALSTLSSIWSKEKILISIAAGVPMAYLAGFFPKIPRIVRVMPNTPALVLSGISALSKNDVANEKDLDLAESIFKAIGETVRVEESQLDAVTGLSGSGPAYVFTILEGLTEAGVKMGLARSVALKLAVQTVWGSSQMARLMNWPLSQLKEMVTSPGGTTIHGLHVLEKAGLHGILMDAVEAATNRSKELGETIAKKA
ncbi:MAG: pyrroline-5-carboxylate reductase [Deltaproteobacteria bacterium RBG_13_43_22]|nr:MAG: pyrroline-5-carboxylate reductase [Deltaproteobacteria bacterium RBG_13_43_22]